MPDTISITAIASLSPLGISPESLRSVYRNPFHHFFDREFPEFTALVAPITLECENDIRWLLQDPRYKSLDRSVLLAIAASRRAVKLAGWQGETFGVNIGSSRGATTLFEKHHEDFLKNGRANLLTSPLTTLGNISSYVAQDLGSKGADISHSITCSTSLHSMLNGIAWLRAGMADKFLVGGSEAPLTAFTLSQMRSLKLYADLEGEFPCRALDLEKTKNSLVLGEAASVCCLEKGVSKNTVAIVEGFGYATEIPEHPTSISAEADCLHRSMEMALAGIDRSTVDVVVMHAPGTVLGDRSEFNAIQNTFGDKMPMLTTNKWKTGHTFGASGMLNIEMAVLMLRYQEFFSVPFARPKTVSKTIRRVLVNGVGFGGNAVSILLTRP